MCSIRSSSHFAAGRANQTACFGGEVFLKVIESDSRLVFADFF
jgi:hypothetical protein